MSCPVLYFLFIDYLLLTYWFIVFGMLVSWLNLQLLYSFTTFSWYFNLLWNMSSTMFYIFDLFLYAFSTPIHSFQVCYDSLSSLFGGQWSPIAINHFIVVVPFVYRLCLFFFYHVVAYCWVALVWFISLCDSLS